MGPGIQVRLGALVGSVVLASIMVAALGEPAAPAVGCSGTSTITCQFTFTGAPETFTVPAGVHQITITAYGAQGGASVGVGGRGGIAIATIAVTPGQVLQVRVGGHGNDFNAGLNPSQGGFNGGGNGTPVNGGGGGGASDVRGGNFSDSSRLIVAGGGGGGANFGTGGVNADGGAGGGTVGADGLAPGGGGVNGTGGSQSGPGAAGTGVINGNPGVGAAGGSGIAGGGGGFFGGGGSASSGTFGQGGAGGGSGFTAGGSGLTQGGAQPGDGLVIISFAAPQPPAPIIAPARFTG
jgi:hypothetical protein